MPLCVRSSDESVGAIEISWIGHGAHDWVANAALVAMWSYLANGDSSPAAKTFVNIPEAYCSGICVNSDSRDPCIVTVLLSNVPVKHLDTLARRFSSFIKDQSHCPLDMKRMSYQLKQQRLSLLGTLETDSSSYVQGSILQEILYGAEDGSQLADVFDDLEIIKKLQTFTENDWLSILDKCVGSSSPPSPPCSRLTLGTLACRWILERHTVTVIAHPSTKLAHDQAAGTKAVVAANRARLGTAGLARAAADLEHAKKVNEHPAPRKIVESYKVPSLDSIGWLKVETARSNGVARGRETFSGRLQSHINADAGDVPYFIQFDHFPSSFVEVAVLLHGPPTELFPLFVDTFFAMPIMREDGTRLSFDQVNRALDELAIGFGAQTLGEGVLVSIQVVKEDYEAAIVWLSDIVYGTQFDDIERCVRLPLYSLHKCPAELTLTSDPCPQPHDPRQRDSAEPAGREGRRHGRRRRRDQGSARFGRQVRPSPSRSVHGLQLTFSNCLAASRTSSTSSIGPSCILNSPHVSRRTPRASSRTSRLCRSSSSTRAPSGSRWPATSSRSRRRPHLGSRTSSTSCRSLCVHLPSCSSSCCAHATREPQPAQLAYLLHERDLLTDLGKNPSRKVRPPRVASLRARVRADRLRLLLARRPSSTRSPRPSRTTSSRTPSRPTGSTSTMPPSQSHVPASRRLTASSGTVRATSLSPSSSLFRSELTQALLPSAAVRGPGLAYGCWIKADIDDGRISFIVFKSPDAHAAFAAGSKLVADLVSGKVRAFLSPYACTTRSTETSC